MAKIKQIIALFLCVLIVSGSFSLVASASSLTTAIVETEESRKTFGDKITDIIQGVLKTVCALYPRPRSWKSIDEYDSTYVYDEEDGIEDIQFFAGDENQWNLGYSSASIIPDDFEENKYYLGRQLNVVASADIAKADGILDDQRVRVICVDDNSGNGAVVLCVIDGLGVTSATIRSIREKLKDYTDDGRIAAINVSATHTHSALDTQGVSTSMLYVMFANNFTNFLGIKRAATSNDSFIENIINVTAENIKTAYSNMEPGKMYYNSIDISQYVHDKREFISSDGMPKAASVKFVPDDTSSKPTYYVNMTCHPTNVSAKAGLVSSDYVYYFDYAIKKSGANFIMSQGAVGMISQTGNIENKENYMTAINELGLKEKLGDLYNKTSVASADVLGEIFAELVLKCGEGEELQPYINAKYAYTQFKTDNYCLHLACRIRLVDNEVYTTGNGLDDLVLPSEVGYLELGGRVGLALFPCELYPEVFHGQEIIDTDAEHYRWSKDETWNFKSGNDMVEERVDCYAICFCNDYIGYVVPDNYYSGWGHWAVKGSNEANYEYDTSASVFDYIFRGTADELLSAGKTTASQIMGVFEKLVSQFEKFD